MTRPAPVSSFPSRHSAIRWVLASSTTIAALLACAGAAAQVRERCAWTGIAADPARADVVHAPVVLDLDADGLPEIAFVAHDDSSATGQLVVVSGADCTERAVVRSLGCQACVDDVACRDLDVNGDGTFLWPWGLAAGDLDGDGSVEIVGLLEGDLSPLFPQRVVAFGADGSFRWCSAAVPLTSAWIPAPLRESLLSIADLDGDGRAEVLVGSRAFDAEGRLVAEAPWLDQLGASMIASDVDRDGRAELVIGAAVVDETGLDLWNRADLAVDTWGLGMTTGPAAADLDGDGFPEILVAESGSHSLHVLDGRTGATRASAVVPGASAPGTHCSRQLGMPALADVDGDGMPEIAVACGRFLSLFGWTAGTPDALDLRWAHPVEDCSSASMSASFSDLTGDGLREVLFRDERSLWLLRGDGTVLQRLDSSSVTYRESVVAADVDGDCSGEIVVAEDDILGGAHRGVRVFEGDGAPLPSMRPAWNQATYHGTNVEDDGSIPRVEEVPRTTRAQESARPRLPDVVVAGGSLWPPNHRLVRVRLADRGGAPIRVTGVFQDEPVEDHGDGSFVPDAVVEPDGGLLLRAERSGRGDGRTYHVRVGWDGGACDGESVVTICVPHDQRRGRRDGGCGDQGPLFDSTRE